MYDLGTSAFNIMMLLSVSFGDIYFLHYIVARILTIYFLRYDVLTIVIDSAAIDFDTCSRI